MVGREQVWDDQGVQGGPLAARPPVERRLAQVVRPIVWCEPTDRIRDVAERISAGAHSCALVRLDAGLGIVTDHDFRRRVGTGEIGIDAPVSLLATTPVLTIDQGATQADGLLRMVEHGVHHLVVTDPVGRPAGVVRAVDLAQAEVRDPLLVRSAVDTAANLAELADAARLLPAAIVALCDSRVAATHIGAVHAAVVDAIVRRVLWLRAEPVFADVPHSWVVLGSLARRESLPLSDVDTALVWADPPAGAADPAESLRAAAGRVLADLRRCDLVPCPSGTNADNPTFSRSRSSWVAAIAAWKTASDDGHGYLMSAMVADSRPLTNPELGRCLADTAPAPGRTRFLRGLLDEALAFRPPVGFVRDFVVEHGGVHSGELDLKKGGLAPVVGLARWVAIATGDVAGSTTERLRRGADRGVLTADEAQTLAVAFDDVYGLLLRHEAEALSRGVEPTTYIAPRHLDTLTRRHLRETFRAIRSVQERLDERWMARLERARW
ncbi:MAG: CBS domain-containing protein [Micromonosporaceae bacterium]|nr:CBS domain-containing protein [Micromonosporaceae bacterium]